LRDRHGGGADVWQLHNDSPEFVKIDLAISIRVGKREHLLDRVDRHVRIDHLDGGQELVPVDRAAAVHVDRAESGTKLIVSVPA